VTLLVTEATCSGGTTAAVAVKYLKKCVARDHALHRFDRWLRRSSGSSFGGAFSGNQGSSDENG
jgi:hypothetical protein